MLIPAFTLELKNPILRNLLAVGKYDGKNPSLTCGTSAGKIFFHSPHEKDPQAQVRFLNINRKISALACGKLEAKTAREVLLVGAQTTLLCYDVEQNADLFFKDAPDGVNTIVVGSMDKAFGGGGNMALVGGNCSIQGFDHQGEEVYTPLIHPSHHQPHHQPHHHPHHRLHHRLHDRLHRRTTALTTRTTALTTLTRSSGRSRATTCRR